LPCLEEQVESDDIPLVPEVLAAPSAGRLNVPGESLKHLPFHVQNLFCLDEVASLPEQCRQSSKETAGSIKHGHCMVGGQTFPWFLSDNVDELLELHLAESWSIPNPYPGNLCVPPFYMTRFL
jgi:hypothetical protein